MNYPEFDYDYEDHDYDYYAEGEDYEEDADDGYSFQPLTWEDQQEDNIDDLLEEFGF